MSLVLYQRERQTMNEAVARALGFGHLLGGGLAQVVMLQGPDGGQGVAWAPSSGDFLLRELEQATWRKHPEVEGAWIGRTPARDEPQQLARAQQLPGHPVELGGATWTVPVARHPGGAPLLPRRLERRGGEWVAGEVAAQHRALWEAAVGLWEQLRENEALPYAELAEAACLALAANYRLGPAEVEALELLTTETAMAVFQALVDWPAIEALAGKAQPAGPSGSPGGLG